MYMISDLKRGCGLGNRTDVVRTVDCIDKARPRALLRITSQTRQFTIY